MISSRDFIQLAYLTLTALPAMVAETFLELRIGISTEFDRYLNVSQSFDPLLATVGGSDHADTSAVGVLRVTSAVGTTESGDNGQLRRFAPVSYAEMFSGPIVRVH